MAVARIPHGQVLGYIRKTVSYADFPTSDGTISMDAAIPDGAFVTDVIVDVATGFNGGTTNVFLVGTSDNDDLFVDADDIAETAGVTRAVTGLGLVSGDTEPLIKFSWTGTVPTAGAATVLIAYASNN